MKGEWLLKVARFIAFALNDGRERVNGRGNGPSKAPAPTRGEMWYRRAIRESPLRAGMIIKKRAVERPWWFCWLEFVFGADFDADAANAPPADVLEMFLHVLRAFFGVVVSFAVRFGELPKDCPCWASAHTRCTFSTAIFDDFSLGSDGHVRNHRRKAHLAAVLFGEKKSAFSNETEP